MLADMRASVDAARLLTWRAAWMARQGEPIAPARRRGSMSKLVAGETAVRVTEQAIQILGGTGTPGSPRWNAGTGTPSLHDLRGHVGVQRMIIGRAITGLDVRWP